MVPCRPGRRHGVSPHAPESGEVFLGFEEGKSGRPPGAVRGGVCGRPHYDLSVTALSVSSDARSPRDPALEPRRDGGVLTSYERMPSASYRPSFGTPLVLQGPVHPGLTLIVCRRRWRPGGDLVRRGIPNIREVSSLACRHPSRRHGSSPRRSCSSALASNTRAERFAALAYDGRAWTLFDLDGDADRADEP